MKLVTMRDSKSRVARLEGSSPSPGTKKFPRGNFLMHGEKAMGMAFVGDLNGFTVYARSSECRKSGD